MTHILPYNGQATYDLEIAGTVRTLPLVQVAPDTWIAYYYSLGDTEVIDRAAQALAPRLEAAELLVTTETKGIPLTHAIATYLGRRPYVICQRRMRPFMVAPLRVRYRPITAAEPQELYMDARDAAKVRGRRVALVDDIVSTGETLQAMTRLVEEAGGEVVARAAILLEGIEQPGVEHLGILPIFKRVARAEAAGAAEAPEPTAGAGPEESPR